MNLKNLKFFIVIIPFISSLCHADLETTSVLPQDVYSPKLMFGRYSGLGDRYNSIGLVQGVADQYHLALSGPTLAKLDSRLKTLIDSLNNFSSTERFGDELSLGTLNIKSAPVVDYFAPTISYGITPDFSFGIGIPLIHFHNEIEVVAGGQSNVEQLRDHTQNTSPQLTQAFDQLIALTHNMPGTLQTVLAARGYKQIQTQDYTALGDLQISGLYNYYSSDHWSLAIRPFVQLPTGRKDDPDDLADAPTGGQPALGVYSIHEYRASPRVNLVSSLGYVANIPDETQMRVPNGVDDILPGPERKTTVSRRTGNSLLMEGGVRYFLNHSIEFGTYYGIMQKDPDVFSGGKGWDYSILSIDTSATTHQIKFNLEFSSVSWYQAKSFSLPLQMGIIYGNTFLAVNSPYQTSNQVYLRMFF